jgi:hypothetical protein
MRHAGKLREDGTHRVPRQDDRDTALLRRPERRLADAQRARAQRFAITSAIRLQRLQVIHAARSVVRMRRLVSRSLSTWPHGNRRPALGNTARGAAVPDFTLTLLIPFLPDAPWSPAVTGGPYGPTVTGTVTAD